MKKVQVTGVSLEEGGSEHRAVVLVRTTARGEKYLQTAADGVWMDNLLALAQP